MELTDRKILVTGASGALGSAVVEELVARNCPPVCHVRENSNTTRIDELGLEKRVADIRDRPALLRLMEGIDGVIHTAALVSFQGDRLTQFTGVNVMGAADMYEAARREGVRRFVHVSTVAAVGARPLNDAPVGAPSLDPLTEEHEFNLDHLRIPYIMTKRAAELELIQARQANQDAPELIMVNPSIIISEATGRSPDSRMSRYFKRYVVPDFSNVVNLVDIRDVAPGVVAALEQGRPGQRYILAGDNIPARDLVLTVSNMIGRTPHLVRIPRPLINLAARVSATLARLRGQGRLEFYPDLVGLLDYDWSFSSEKARQELGFQARSIYHTLTDLLSKAKEA